MTEPITWNDRLLLGYPAMDAEHREFVAIVHALQTAPPAGLLQHLDAFAQHAQRHFGSEDRWMVETDFPARDCHIDEHAAVMKSVAEVRALAADGNLSHVRPLADELARWFPGHADYLDSALSAWLSKRRWQAQPVVLRRQILET
jgi:hemerythrin-like metal-binding protein